VRHGKCQRVSFRKPSEEAPHQAYRAEEGYSPVQAPAPQISLPVGMEGRTWAISPLLLLGQKARKIALQ